MPAPGVKTFATAMNDPASYLEQAAAAVASRLSEFDDRIVELEALVSEAESGNANPAVYVQVNPAVSSYTYNDDDSVATETVAGVTTTFAYNIDGTVHTSTRAGITRTYAYDGSGLIVSVT